MSKSLKPKNLGVEGSALWDSIMVGRELGPDAARLLMDACREADLVQRLDDELEDAPLMVQGSQGQLVASPLVSEIRQHRASLAALLKSLRLPASAGQVAGDSASDQARAAARARWDRPRLVG